MLLTQALAEIRDTIDDSGVSSNLTFSDAELARHISRQERRLFRRQADVDESYHNCDINLIKANFVEVAKMVWEYPLPTWAERVVNVWQRVEPTGASVEDEAPALTVDANGAAVPQTKLQEIRMSDMHLLDPGWRLEGKSTFRLARYATVFAMYAQVAKRPAPATRGTIVDVHASASKFYMVNEANALANNGLHDPERHAYRETVFQFSSATDSGGSVVTGLNRRCVGSQLVVLSGQRTMEITLDRALPRALGAGDTYETVLSIPDVSTRLLVLLVARACFEKKPNPDAMRAITQELADEEREFMAFVSPRGMQEPKFVRETMTQIGSRRLTDTSDPDLQTSWF